MGAGNFGSPVQLLILLVVVLLLFGGNRLRSLGSDLGGAIKGFKNSMASSEDEKKSEKVSSEPHLLPPLVDANPDTNVELQKSQHKVGG